MTDVADIFRSARREDPAEAHFHEYRRLSDRIHLKGVEECARIWIDWQTTTARILAQDEKNAEIVEGKKNDAKQRANELPRVLERSRKW